MSSDTGDSGNQKNQEVTATATRDADSQGQVVPSIANAAKELRHRMDPHAESGESTPSIANTAAEVADSAALLDNDDKKGEQPTAADAAKELRHRTGLHSESGASTPGIAKTAAEVADSAAILDKEDDNDNQDEQPTVANAAKELFHRLDPHSGSGASTPGFVRTAAEVADSAALLDRDDDEPKVTDEEAGRTGYRRLSATPIPDIANTAAEVADTAQALDSEVSTK